MRAQSLRAFSPRLSRQIRVISCNAPNALEGRFAIVSYIWLSMPHGRIVFQQILHDNSSFANLALHGNMWMNRSWLVATEQGHSESALNVAQHMCRVSTAIQLVYA